MKRILLGAGGFLLVVALLSGLRATTAVRPAQSEQMLDPSEVSVAVDMSLAEMAAAADLIALGKCSATRSVWADRDLVTLARVELTDVLKGQPSSAITVVLPGGVDANRKFPVSVTYPGAPRITPSEEVFLFLTRENQVADGYVVMGFAQGKFSIVEDEQGEKVVSRDLTGVQLRGKGGSRRGTASAAPLNRFKAAVQSYLHR